jgi:hypothetical protein
VETIMRRSAAKRTNISNLIALVAWFKGSLRIEKIHPLESGIFRLKFRRDRRPGLPVLPVWKFYPTYAAETLHKLAQWGSLLLKLRRIQMRVKRDPRKLEYTDLALTPVTDDDVANLEMFHNAAAEAFVAREQRRQQPHPAAA